jgi:hypothetical protein
MARSAKRDDIGEITRIYGNFTDGETRKLNIDSAVKELVVSKIFDNADFGFHKITVERPLRLAFEITDEKLDAIEHGTTGIGKIDKLPAETREHVVGQLRDKARPGVLKSREKFDDWLKHALPDDQYVTKSLRIVLRDAFSERDETADICIDSRGKPEPDPELRDTENVPLKEKIHDYFKREVSPHVPDAWIDENKTKIGYEIPLNRHFYRYEPPRPLEEIESDIKTLESEIEKRTALISRTVTGGLNPNVRLKPSGIEWLGDIPEHWEVKKLRYLALLKSGENITSEELEEAGDYPVFGGNGLRGYSSRFTHEGNYVLIGRQGALCGNINYASGRFWASEHAVVVTPIRQFATIWLGELLRTMNLNQYSVSAAQPGLSVDAISALKIPVPPTKEQNLIAEYLDRETAKLDRMMEKVEAAIEKLQEYRTALVTAAVTGKIDVRKNTA